MAKRELFFGLLMLSLLPLWCVATASEASAQGVKTIVIDPGHGGKISPGATYHGVYEKNVVLPIALKVGELLEKSNPEVKVIFTRKSDTQLRSTISADLGARTALANSAGADLFVSIHANAAANTSAHGAETIIMGESSLEQQRNEAALYANNREDLLDMSNEKTAAIVRAYIQNLQFTYGEYSEALANLIQKGYKDSGRSVRALRRQPLMVLYGADMPAVLTEIGFMTNSADFKLMTSKAGQLQIAQSIHSGIAAYIKMLNSTLQDNEQSREQHAEKESVAEPLTSGYTVQVLSSRKEIDDKDLYQFRQYRGEQWYYIGKGSYKYKYCVGRFATREQAVEYHKQVVQTFKDAYVIKF